MLIASLLISGLFLAGLAFVARSREGIGAAGWIAAAVVLVGLLGILPLVALQALLIVPVAVVCYLLKTRRRTFVSASLAASLVPYLLAGASIYDRLQDRRELRAQYPYRSLSDRLAYETQFEGVRQSIDGPAVAETPASLSGSDTDPVDALEDQLRTAFHAYSSHGRARAVALERLHDRSLDQFAAQAGFGPVRMSGLAYGSKHYIELPPAEPTPQPESQPPIGPYVPGKSVPAEDLTGLAAAAASDLFPTTNQLVRLHRDGYVDFANPDRFGHVVDRDRVAGFEPHQFQRVPALPRQSESLEASEQWGIARIELVSLLKFGRPAVYVSEYLPRMDQLATAATRPLDAFEQDGLTRLERGEELVVENARDRIRMLGAVRAVSQCLDCHKAQRSDLLGAFSYRLSRNARANVIAGSQAP